MSIFGEEKFIIANFKQSGGVEDSLTWIKEFKSGIDLLGELKVNIVVCPSFPLLDLFQREISKETYFKKRLFLGSQNISERDNLENTGEVSSKLLSEFVNFSLVGHSERKENFDEVTRKYEQAIQSGIVPIVCFYENKAVYSFENCLFAYEDPKSISKEGVYQEKDFNELVGIIEDLKELFDSKPVLYGGSVKPENVQMIKDLNFFKGVLVGRSSLDPKTFIEIIKIYNK